MRSMTIALLISAGISLPVQAQDEMSGAAAAPSDAERQSVQLQFRVYEERRRLVLEDGMMLSEEHAAAFWPLYDEYAAEQTLLMDRMADLIVDYAAAWNRGMVDDDTAEDLLDTWLDLQEDEVDLKKRFARRMNRELPAHLVARFFQLEHRLDAVFDVSLGSQIPLAADDS